MASVEEQFYNFPPFFTLQTVDSTREKQILLWRRLILNYFSSNKSIEPVLSLDSFPLFENSKIDRKASQECIEAVVNDLIHTGHGQWQEQNKTLYVFVKTPSDWASIIEDFVQKNALSGSIYTLYEIHSGDLTRGSQLEGIDPNACLTALNLLQQQGKAQIFPGADSVDETGIKFI